MFTIDIERNNLYSKYIPKFDEIYNKVVLKIQKNKKFIKNKKEDETKN